MNKFWATFIYAKIPGTDEIRKYGGPYVPGRTKLEAQLFCENNGLGYCHVDLEIKKVEAVIGETAAAYWPQTIEIVNINLN